MLNSDLSISWQQNIQKKIHLLGSAVNLTAALERALKTDCRLSHNIYVLGIQETSNNQSLNKCSRFYAICILVLVKSHANAISTPASKAGRDLGRIYLIGLSFIKKNSNVIHCEFL